MYEPIHDARAATIGILFVGVPLAEAQAFMSKIIGDAAIGGAVIALLAGLSYFCALRMAVRPITILANLMRQIADKRLDCAIPFTARRSDWPDGPLGAPSSGMTLPKTSGSATNRTN